MYQKTDWNSAKITADNFNKMQTQYTEAVQDALGVRLDNTELRAEIVSDFPTHKQGRIIFHTGLKMFFFSTGSEWHLEPSKSFWGDAQNGVFSSSGNITFSNTLGETVARNYRSFTLNANHTITTQTGCRALIIRAWEDIFIDGVIDLDYKGGFGERFLTLGTTSYDLLGGFGGNGGNGGGETNGGKTDSGIRGAGGLRGGGGGGGGANCYAGAGGDKNSTFDIVGANGTRGRISQGESGCGGEDSGTATDGQHGGGGGGAAFKLGTDGYAYAGLGGTARGGAGGGGGATEAGNVSTNRSASAEDGRSTLDGQYGGGVVVLLAGGNIVINGQITARGSDGEDGGDANSDYRRAGGYAGGGGAGGGSGGGKVLILHRGAYNFAGDIDLRGGYGGKGGSGWDYYGSNFDGEDGENGENGTTTVLTI